MSAPTPERHDAVPLLHDYLTHSARLAPTKIALVCGQARLSYAQLDSRSAALAAQLAAIGVARGDRVMIYADNSVAAVIAFWAVLRANAIVVMVNPLTRRDKLDYLLRDCRPTALLADARLASEFAAPARASADLRGVIVTGAIDDTLLASLPDAERWDEALARGASQPPPARESIDIDLAAIVYTSGSTGDAKGVMLTHRNMLSAASSVAGYLEIRPDDVLLCVLPLAFDYGLYQMIMAFRAGARLVLERSFAFPAQSLRIVEREGVTGFPGVPTIFATLAEMKTLDDYDLSRVRFVTNTAAHLSAKLIDFLANRFPRARIHSMYGLTECKRCTWLPPADLHRKPGSVGIAIPNTELWLIDEAGEHCAPGVVGQLVIRGATVMAGYWEKPQASAEKLKPGRHPGEQVLHTGDLCRLDEDGYLYFVARMDDIIKSRGEKVAPKEVESVLLNIAGVRAAAVIGIPDPVLGQAVKAFVVAQAGARLTEKELLDACRRQLEAFMIPKFIELVDALPTTATGKISKQGLS